MNNKKYNNLVSDLNLMIEKFEEIKSLHESEVYHQDNDFAYGRKKGAISAYNNVIGVLKGLIQDEKN